MAEGAPVANECADGAGHQRRSDPDRSYPTESLHHRVRGHSRRCDQNSSAAPPVDGAANDELIRFLARRLSIPPTSVQIHSGAGGRHKRVLVKGINAQLVMACLNLGGRKEPVMR